MTMKSKRARSVASAVPLFEHPKLCLSCARDKLAKRPMRPCVSCALLNVDPMAQVRANAALPSPLTRFQFRDGAVPEAYGPALKPARPTPSDRGR